MVTGYAVSGPLVPACDGVDLSYRVLSLTICSIGSGKINEDTHLIKCVGFFHVIQQETLVEREIQEKKKACKN